MKKKKMNLQTLKVQSFLTNVDQKAEQTIKGGAYTERGDTGCAYPTDANQYHCFDIKSIG